MNVFPLNKPIAINMAMRYSALMLNRQREKMVIDAESEILRSYEALLKRSTSHSRKVILRNIAKNVSFLYLVKGDDYCKIALYRVFVHLASQGLIWIAWKMSGHPKPKTAYFFVKRTIHRPTPVVPAGQVSFWMGEAGLHNRRQYE